MEIVRLKTQIYKRLKAIAIVPSAVSEPLTADVILNDIQICQRRRVIVICFQVNQTSGLAEKI